MIKALITTVPFAANNSIPIELMKNANIEFTINPFDRKLSENDLLSMVSDIDIIIAGTEPITSRVIEKAKKLKLISRVGVGLDSVDLLTARKNNVTVAYTPDAPAPAVAELTIGLMLNLLRSVHISNQKMHNGNWDRIFGRRLAEVTIGIIGVGRIGTRVLNRTKGFGTPRILLNDIMPNRQLDRQFKLDWVTKDTIYKEADIISLHLPLTNLTHNMIKEDHLRMMKKNAIIINTSRGGIINENDLYSVMQSGHLLGSAIDVFEKEPYAGPLKEINRCILTSHMGSMSEDCRERMEIEAVENAIRYLSNMPLLGPVPESEFNIQSQKL